MQTRTFSALDITEKAIKAGGELYYEHKQLISGLNREYLEEHSISMKRDLIDLAGMSLLFAFQQILTIQTTFTTDSGDLIGFSDTPASATFNFFSLAGVAFNILGAVFALTSVLALRKMNNTIRQVKSNSWSPVWRAHDGAHFCSRERGCTIPIRFPDDLRRLLHITDYHSNVNFVVFVAFNAGMAFYFISLHTLGVISNQPVEAWFWVLVSITVMVWFFVIFPSTRTYWGKFFLYMSG